MSSRILYLSLCEEPTENGGMPQKYGQGMDCAEGFKERGGVVGVRTQCYMASYWPAD